MGYHFHDIGPQLIEEFGRNATLTRADGSTEVCQGVLYSPSGDDRLRLTPNAGLTVTSQEPHLFINLKYARPCDPEATREWVGPTPQQNEEISVADDDTGSGPMNYTVYDLKLDGIGGCKLVLKVAD